MARSLRIAVLVFAVLGFGLAAGAHAQTTPAASPEAQAGTCSTPVALDAKAPTAQEVLFSLEPVAPQEVQQCPLCNLTGYQSCDAMQSQSCPVSGTTKRCYLLPACYCEWSICRCQSGAWSCAY